MTMMPQQYCLRWKHHHTNVQNMFAQLLEKERFCDVTLYCSPSFATQVSNKEPVDPQNIRGVSLRAHRVVLAACSELLGALLGAHEAHGEPVLVIDGAEPRHLKALLDYMYTGEMNVHHSQLASLLKTAEELRIKGLTDIRWNNKDEPPDSADTGVVATATSATPAVAEKSEKQDKSAEKAIEKAPPKQPSPKQPSPKQPSPKQPSPRANNDFAAELRNFIKKEQDTDTDKHEKFNVNGGPPPLIKLPIKDKASPLKRELSDSESPSPKRQRAASGTDHTDDELTANLKTERDLEWQHGNLDITAERVVGWGMGEAERESSRDASDDEWADAPADIGSFLHTKLRVDGDNSADEESNDSAAGPACRSTAASSSSSTTPADKLDHAPLPLHCKPTVGPKSGPTDPRFTDVVKLSEYLQHGRRPQFWEEHYVKRVMEAVRLKELEMKQAAEILGVSYGTLYGRYRDVYGCINRPYRAVRDFWQAKGPSEVLERLQRGDMSLDAAARALGVTIANLAAHVADFGHAGHAAPATPAEFEPIPIEVDASLKGRARTYSDALALAKLNKKATPPAATPADKSVKKVVVGSITDEDPIPATVITTHESKPFNVPPATTGVTTNTSGKWPTIRVASIDSLRGNDSSTPAVSAALAGATGAGAAAGGVGGAGGAGPTSPSQLMRTRPDLTIVAARKQEHKRDDDT